MRRADLYPLRTFGLLCSLHSHAKFFLNHPSLILKTLHQNRKKRS